jgi:hypothetical protein
LTSKEGNKKLAWPEIDQSREMNLFFLMAVFQKPTRGLSVWLPLGGSLKHKKAQQAIPAEELQSELDYRTLTALANTMYLHLWLDITNEA